MKRNPVAQQLRTPKFKPKKVESKKKYKSRSALGWKKQWRWRCSHRDAFYVACLMWPYSHIKLGKLQKIIDHYKDIKIMNDKVVSLKDYKQFMGLE